MLISLHHCNGEVVYVTATIPLNPDCPDGLPCHTLKQYFSNNSLTQQSTNLIMIFLPGQHAGVCKRTELKSFSFNATGVGQVVTINCTTIVFSNAMEIYFTNLTLDHWHTSSPCLSILILEMSSVVLQNQTHVLVKHASNISGNRVKLVNTIFKNSSISGELSFINNVGAMFLAHSTLKVRKNTSITFVKNQIHPGMYLNHSTLIVESNVHMTFTNNSRSSFMMKFSIFNLMKITNIIFISNSNASEEGVAMNIEESTINTEGDLTFINNSGERETVVIQTSTFSIRNSVKLQFVNNSARTQAGGIFVYRTTVIVKDNASMTFINNTASKNGAMGMLYSIQTICQE